MTHSFDLLFSSMLNQSAPVLYLLLFASAIMENLFPPIPGDTVTAFGAFLAGTGRLSFWGVYLCTTVGSTVGFFLLFYLFRILGIDFIEKRKLKWLKRQHIESAKNKIGTYGYLVILINRFLPGIRSAISITSGILQMSPIPVAILSLISAAAWNLIWISAGLALGKSWDLAKHRLSEIVHQYNFAAGSVLCLLVLLFLIWIIRKNKKRPKRRS
jgi:membrane protein DedA with SNARE-associated domain